MVLSKLEATMGETTDGIDYELIGRLIAHQNDIDYQETGPKAPHGDITYKGVRLSSRYDVLAEFNYMKSVIDFMPELMARRITSIWCDSKGSNFYSVILCPKLFVDSLPYCVDAAFRARGWYNGLSIECDGKNIPHRDCYFPEY